MNNYYVYVMEYEGGKVVKEFGPFGKRKAERISGGLNINLNQEIFYTKIIQK